MLVVQSCLTLCDTIDCFPPGSSVYGILQARILEWVAISYSRGSSRPRDRTLVSCISCIGRLILYHCTSWEALVLIPRGSTLTLPVILFPRSRYCALLFTVRDETSSPCLPFEHMSHLCGLC